MYGLSKAYNALITMYGLTPINMLCSEACTQKAQCDSRHIKCSVSVPESYWAKLNCDTLPAVATSVRLNKMAFSDVVRMRQPFSCAGVMARRSSNRLKVGSWKHDSLF